MTFKLFKYEKETFVECKDALFGIWGFLFAVNLSEVRFVEEQDWQVNSRVSDVKPQMEIVKSCQNKQGQKSPAQWRVGRVNTLTIYGGCS